MSLINLKALDEISPSKYNPTSFLPTKKIENIVTPPQIIEKQKQRFIAEITYKKYDPIVFIIIL